MLPVFKKVGGNLRATTGKRHPATISDVNASCPMPTPRHRVRQVFAPCIALYEWRSHFARGEAIRGRALGRKPAEFSANIDTTPYRIPQDRAFEAAARFRHDDE